MLTQDHDTKNRYITSCVLAKAKSHFAGAERISETFLQLHICAKLLLVGVRVTTIIKDC